VSTSKSVRSFQHLKPCSAAIMTFLLISSVFSPFMHTASAQERATVERHGGWTVIKTDLITVMIPAQGQYPMFLWWYTGQNDTVYAVHYKGLVEYYLPEGRLFTHRRAADLANLATEFFQERQELLQQQFRTFEALRIYLRNVTEVVPQLGGIFGGVLLDNVDRSVLLADNIKEKMVVIAERAEEAGEVEIEEKALDVAVQLEDLKSELGELKTESSPMRITEIAGDVRQVYNDTKDLAEAVVSTVQANIKERALELRRLYLIVQELKERLHPPIFPFFNGVWELILPQAITDSNGEEIGLSFAFHLKEVRNPVWKFAEGRIMVKCRFYYVPVQESSDELVYKVGRGEMKMDLQINGWNWNIDEVTKTVNELRSAGINITAPNIERAGLALWVDLTSAKFDRVRNVRNVGETFEEIGNTTSLKKAAEEVLESTRDLTEAVKEGYETLTQAIAEVEREIAADSTDWAEVQEEILKVMDKSIDNVVDSLLDMKRLIAEGLTCLEATSGAETYRELGNDLTVAADHAIEKLRSINETLANLLDVQDGSMLKETHTAVYRDYKATFEELRESALAIANRLRNELENLAARLAERARATTIRIEDKVIGLTDRLEEDERPVAIGAKLGEDLKLGFATDDGLLAGWFKFVNASKVTYPDTSARAGSTDNHPVRAAYIEAGNHLRLYMIYPYFDNAMLEHDPSIGLDVEETTSPEAQEPKYTITPPSGDEILPSSVEMAVQQALPTTTIIATAAAVALVAVAAVFYSKRR